MSWLKKVFEKKKDQEIIHESKESELLLKLDASINQCNSGIKKAGDEMDQIKKWASEAIRDTYIVPKEFWYEELEKYTEIKSLTENKSIGYKVVIKCDEIISSYFEQIKLREVKITLYNSLIDKYKQNKIKMLAIKKRNDADKSSKAKLEALEKHSIRLEQMKTNPENIESPVEETYQLDILKNEAKEVYEEFEISEEVRADLEEINSQFKTGNLSSDSKSAIEKIEDLTNRIKMDNSDFNE